jgi:hypothetical protein
MNVKEKQIIISKLIEVLPKILDRYKASKFIPLTWKNNLTTQTVIFSAFFFKKMFRGSLSSTPIQTF